VGERIGGSAFAKRHQLRRNHLVVSAVSKSKLTSQTPTRRHADTPTRRSVPQASLVIMGRAVVPAGGIHPGSWSNRGIWTVRSWRRRSFVIIGHVT